MKFGTSAVLSAILTNLEKFIATLKKNHHTGIA
jgi:hypothetical protein